MKPLRICLVVLSFVFLTLSLWFENPLTNDFKAVITIFMLAGTINVILAEVRNER